MIRVLVDYHHSVLYESLALLFVDRAILGPAELHTLGDVTDVFPGEWRGRRQVAWDEAERQRWDVVVGTAPQYREACARIAGLARALYVDQVGNAWDAPIGDTVLWSVVPTDMTVGITYHPEFHRLPYLDPPADHRRTVRSFHSGLADQPCMSLWRGVSERMTDLRWVLHGIDESIAPADVAQARRESGFAWHDKLIDGYGLSIHEAFASGRVVLGHDHYRGKIAGPLFEDGVTCLSFGDDATAAAARIRRLIDEPERHRAMCRAAYERFRDLVDFEAEAAAVAHYLNRARTR